MLGPTRREISVTIGLRVTLSRRFRPKLRWEIAYFTAKLVELANERTEHHPRSSARAPHRSSRRTCISAGAREHRSATQKTCWTSLVVEHLTRSDTAFWCGTEPVRAAAAVASGVMHARHGDMPESRESNPGTT